ncbi:MAG: helix-turn-helix domain-containing protein, partial [Myxococcales bacterium]|nr:helix-turn-helix domain-containing protein [Myxococcales bacterium]
MQSIAEIVPKSLGTGRRTTTRGFTKVPNALLFGYARLGLTPGQFAFVCQVLSYQWDERAPYPSLAKIARRSGVHRDTLRLWVGDLERRGLLRAGRRPGRTIRFDFTPLLEAAGALEAPPGNPGGARVEREPVWEGAPPESAGTPPAASGAHQEDEGTRPTQEERNARGGEEADSAPAERRA